MKNNERKNKAFGIVFIALVITVMLLMSAVTVLTFTGLKNSAAEKTMQTARPTATGYSYLPLNTPAAESPPVPVTPTPIATPEINESDRIIPELDGNNKDLVLSDENPIPDIFEAVNSSVVGVLNYKTNFFAKQAVFDVFATGTGFVVSSSGYILTNAHVISDSEYVSVMLASGEEHFVKVIGSDAETDIAVLKLDGVPVKPLAIGDSDKVRVGEYVLAIGNPIDNERLSNTLTFGIVSATQRTMTMNNHTNTFIQTDAAVNYGNSGGPLLNMRGEVIGVTSAKTVTAGYDAYGNTVSAEGIGFALPINNVIKVMNQLIENRSIDRPGIGITVSTLSDATAAMYGTKTGITIMSVVENGPADKAGLRPGDRLLNADGIVFDDHLGFVAYISEKKIGDKVTLLIEREGKELTISFTLENKTLMDFSKEKVLQPK